MNDDDDGGGDLCRPYRRTVSYEPRWPKNNAFCSPSVVVTPVVLWLPSKITSVGPLDSIPTVVRFRIYLRKRKKKEKKDQLQHELL